MRPLTTNEAQVIALLLGSDLAESERARIRRTGLPRATYQSIRRRAYAEGWLFDRFFPATTPMGRSTALFVVAHPFAEKARELEMAWEKRGEIVVFWASAQTFFAVAFPRDEEAARNLVESLAPTDRVRSVSYVRANLTSEASVPVYFDYEGYWSHLVGTSGPVQYPRGLARGPSGRGRLSEGAAGTLERLVARPTVPDDGRPLHRLGPVGIPRSQRRLLEANYAVHRVLVDPSRLPPFGDHRSDMLVLLQGRLEGQVTAKWIFEQLVRGRIYPFLAAEGDGRFLALFMGQRHLPNTPTKDHGQAPVSLLETLRGGLSEVEVIREDWTELRHLVNHRYERLFERAVR